MREHAGRARGQGGVNTTQGPISCTLADRMAACSALTCRFILLCKVLGTYEASLSYLAPDFPSGACGVVFYWYCQHRAQLCRPPERRWRLRGLPMSRILVGAE